MKVTELESPPAKRRALLLEFAPGDTATTTETPVYSDDGKTLLYTKYTITITSQPPAQK